ncbi:hypothetical protein EDD16DRAFT_616298 [Pisolithus croceorrhizus]|nr:hypothetical protein EDD16DRAFT_616298 [Pisolithus croceorrhizus]KAI6130947.1 hypothetical protein EV401DRAFT_484435 [Pisolithus croceorrhizus]
MGHWRWHYSHADQRTLPILTLSCVCFREVRCASPILLHRLQPPPWAVSQNRRISVIFSCETPECHEQPAKGLECSCMCERRVTTLCQNTYTERSRTSHVGSVGFVIMPRQLHTKSGTNSLNWTSALIQGRQKVEVTCNSWPTTPAHRTYAEEISKVLACPFPTFRKRFEGMSVLSNQFRRRRQIPNFCGPFDHHDVHPLLLFCELLAA